MELDRFRGCWTIREEARESWDNVSCDEVVYVAHPLKGNLEFSHEFTKKYLDGDCWFELHCTFQDEFNRESHFQCILEVALDKVDEISPLVWGESGKANVERIAIHGDSSMFVHRPKLIELPEGIVAIGCPSEVRLKVIDLRCDCGWKQTSLSEVSVIPTLGNRELNVPLLFFGECALPIRVGKIPGELVECRPETANEVTQRHGDDGVDRAHVDAKHVLFPLKIGVFANGIGILKPIADARFKCFKVNLRPAGFHININEGGQHFSHDEVLSERSMITA